MLARKMGFDNEQLAEQMQRSGLFSAPSNRIHRVGSIDKANAVLDEAVVMLYAPTADSSSNGHSFQCFVDSALISFGQHFIQLGQSATGQKQSLDKQDSSELAQGN